MQPQTILYIIFGVIFISYLFKQILDYIDLKWQRSDIPDEIARFCDRAKYLKSLNYHRDLTNFSFITSAFEFLLLAILLLTGGFGWLDSVLRGYFHKPVLLSLSFFGVLLLASDILTLP